MNAVSRPLEPELHRRPSQVVDVPVDVRNVSIVYPGRRPGDRPFLAAVDIDLTITQGEFVAIVGKSGCGKTSLLNAIAGLLPGTYSGTIRVSGRPPELMRKEIGYMFARDALLPWRSALRNVEFPLEKRLSRSSRKARARELLRHVGLGDFESRLPHELSQGMRQRVALARTLSTDPKLILADEPFAALDAQTRLRVQEVFLREWEDEERTVILVTHDLQEAILLADRVLIMADQPGRVVADQRVKLPRPRAGRLADLFATDEFRTMYHKLFDDLRRFEGDSD